MTQAATSIACRSCAAQNLTRSRFCVTCGEILAAGAHVAMAPRRGTGQNGHLPFWRRPELLTASGVAVAIFTVGSFWAFSGHGQSSAYAVSYGGQSASNVAQGTDSNSTDSNSTDSNSTDSNSTDSNSTDSNSTDSAAAQIDALLQQAVQLRAGVQPDVDEILDCADAEAGAAGLRAVAGQRRQLAAQLRSVDLTTLSGGSNMVEALASAWDASAKADDDFAAWGDDNRGCTGTADVDDAHYRAATALSDRATHGKQTFLVSWNPDAPANGVSTYDAGQI
jgi:hypothetical protein